MNSKPTLRRTAWHEAGHAVVAWERGCTAVFVSIQPDGESLGRSRHTPCGDPSIPSERERENIIAMAGWASELASGETDGDGTYDSSDLAYVLNGIVHHTGEDSVAVQLGWAEREAERIVSENIERIERLADQLLRRRELTNTTEIGAIIEGRQGRLFIAQGSS
jgi:ATP-dependent Zn protease